MRKKTKHWNVKNPHTWCGGFSGSFLTIKLGKFWNVDLFWAHWLRLWPKFQASHPPNPFFLWEILEVEIVIFKRDWKYQARLVFFKIWALRVFVPSFRFCTLVPVLGVRRPVVCVLLPVFGIQQTSAKTTLLETTLLRTTELSLPNHTICRVPKTEKSKKVFFGVGHPNLDPQKTSAENVQNVADWVHQVVRFAIAIAIFDAGEIAVIPWVPKVSSPPTTMTRDFSLRWKIARKNVPIAGWLATGTFRGRHGGVEKRGWWKTSRMTPLPKRGLDPPPPRTVRFPPRSGVSALSFLYKSPRQSRPEALLEGSNNFRESAFSGTFSSPHTFCTPRRLPDYSSNLCNFLNNLDLLFTKWRVLVGIPPKKFTRTSPTTWEDKFLGNTFSGLNFHWEIKGRFRKRVVLANVPSFRFSFRGNIRRNHPFGNHPSANPRKGSLGDKRAVSKRAVLANVPSFRFSFRGNIRRNHPFGNNPFGNPRNFRRTQMSNLAVVYQGFPNLRLRQGRLVTGPLVLSLGLPHGGTEVQPLTYVLEHWEKCSKSTSVRDSWVGPRSGPENAAEIGPLRPRH